MNNIKYLVVIFFCFLTACAPPRPANELPGTTPQKQESQTTKVIPLAERKAKTATVSSWEIRGAMAAKNKAKGWSASMNWVQHGASSYQIRLMGPLGSGTVLINKNGNTITFQDGPKTVSSTNADELLLKQTGIKLPVNNLYYWIRGIPAPGSVGAEQHDQYNHLVQLKQSGYTIDFANYSSVKGIDLPGIVRLQGNGVMVKVIIKNWVV